MKTRPAPRVRRRLTRWSCGSTERMWSSASCIRTWPRFGAIWQRPRRRSTAPTTSPSGAGGGQDDGSLAQRVPASICRPTRTIPRSRPTRSVATTSLMQAMSRACGARSVRTCVAATRGRRRSSARQRCRRHRLLRRGVEYGPHLPDGALEDDGVDRGLINLFIQADIERQFEFVQKEWMKGGEFIGTRSERAGPDQRRRRRRLANVGARRQATVPVRSADLRQGQGRRISVRSRAESARRA